MEAFDPALTAHRLRLVRLKFRALGRYLVLSAVAGAGCAGLGAAAGYVVGAAGRLTTGGILLGVVSATLGLWGLLEFITIVQECYQWPDWGEDAVERAERLEQEHQLEMAQAEARRVAALASEERRLAREQQQAEHERRRAERAQQRAEIDRQQTLRRADHRRAAEHARGQRLWEEVRRAGPGEVAPRVLAHFRAETQTPLFVEQVAAAVGLAPEAVLPVVLVLVKHRVLRNEADSQARRTRVVVADPGLLERLLHFANE
jgi:hypothetical protein